MPLPPNEKGEKLLIGRSNYLKKIRSRLCSSSNIVTVEGQNGIGKTSLVNVAAYEIYKNFISTGEGPFMIPCDIAFQLSPEKDIEIFIDEVLFGIVQTLNRKGQEVKAKGSIPKGNDAVKNWLDVPPLDLKDMHNNKPKGMQEAELRVKILNWLQVIFPYGKGLGHINGVVCIVDNLELLQTSAIARKQIEQLRDTLFSYTGIRWVLCGSLGIVFGIASSPRLEGRLIDPIEVDGISPSEAGNILESRVLANAKYPNEVYLPLTRSEFIHLFGVLNNNIRNTLSYTNNYCLWIDDENLHPITNEEKATLYYKWMEIVSGKILDAIQTQLKRKAMSVFLTGVKVVGGAFSTEDFEEFGFANPGTMRSHINTLHKLGLVHASRDEGDKRRKNIQVTPKGWLVYYGLLLKKGISVASN